MLFLDSIVHDVEAFPESIAPVLVADSEVFEVEWFGMSHFSSQRTPFAVDGAVTEFNKVESVLYEYAVESCPILVGIEGCYILMSGKLARNAVIKHGQRSCAERLGHKEILVEAHIL